MNHFLVNIPKPQEDRYRAIVRCDVDGVLFQKAVEAERLKDLTDCVLYLAQRASYDSSHEQPTCPDGICDGHGYYYEPGWARLCKNPVCQGVLGEMSKQRVSFDASSEVAPDTAAFLNNY